MSDTEKTISSFKSQAKNIEPREYLAALLLL